MAEHLELKEKNWEKATHKVEEKIKKEENARLCLEEAKTQAQLLNLMRYVAINQSEVNFFLSYINTSLHLVPTYTKTPL